MNHRQIVFQVFSTVLFLIQSLGISSVVAATREGIRETRRVRDRVRSVDVKIGKMIRNRPQELLIERLVDVDLNNITKLIEPIGMHDYLARHIQIESSLLWLGHFATFDVRVGSERVTIEGNVIASPNSFFPFFKVSTKSGEKKVFISDIISASVAIKEDVKNQMEFQNLYGKYPSIPLNRIKFPLIKDSFKFYGRSVVIYIENAFGEKIVIEGIVDQYPANEEFTYWTLRTKDGLVSIHDYDVINVQEVRLLSQKQYK